MNGYLWQMLLGTVLTLQLALSAFVIGSLLGLFAAFLEASSNRFLRRLTSFFIFILRALPEILILFFIYFGLTTGLSEISQGYINISPFIAGCSTLSLIFSAYASQVFRSAFLSIHEGQLHAAQAFGFTTAQVFLKIKIPQAFRHALPGLGNLWLVLIKDTAIVTLIGLSDLMNQARMAAASTQDPFTFYFIAACIYLLITTISQTMFSLYGKHLSQGQRHD
ncbi:MAG: ABC transporter permease subunit [Gammaproteobacteria bacterium]|nr:ABC transporter permease subunit [Gammaproteobacteria bacterium]